MENIHMKASLIFGNEKSEIGIITLWTKKELIADKLEKADFCILGNLYSRSEGISTIIRNCLKTKTIRYLIITGVDLNQSGAALVALKEHGVNDDHSIKGIDDSHLDKNIPLDAIERFRENVDIIDCKNKKPEELHTLIQSLEKKGSYGEPEEFKFVYDKPHRYPTDVSGWKVKGYTLEELKQKTLFLIERFGIDNDTERELLNMVLVFVPEKNKTILFKIRILIKQITIAKILLLQKNKIIVL